MSQNYRKKQNKIRKKIKTWLPIVIICLLVIYQYVLPSDAKQRVDHLIYNIDNSINQIQNGQIPSTILSNSDITMPASDAAQLPNDDSLTVQYLDVGQADAILISNNGESMLIDAGNNSDGKLVAQHLKNLGINKLKYIINTHADEDHCGGLDNVIESIPADYIMLPNYESSTRSYQDVVAATKASSAEQIQARVGDTFTLGNAQWIVLCCDNEQDMKQYSGNSTNTNASSIVIKMIYGDNSFLFTGDAITDNEEKMMRAGYDLSAKILKVGHHGSKTSSSEDFIVAVDPEIGIISVGQNNEYGLPKDIILERYENWGTKIFRTDCDGTVIVTATPTEYSVVCDKSINLNGD